jgi:hypothetical protein
MNATNSIHDAALASFDRETAAARNTSCDFANCDGSGHEANVASSQWFHRVASEKFDGRVVEIDITATPQGVHVAGLWIDGTGSDMSAADLRREADLYDSYPTLLRRMADRLDELNKVSI